MIRSWTKHFWLIWLWIWFWIRSNLGKVHAGHYFSLHPHGKLHWKLVSFDTEWSESESESESEWSGDFVPNRTKNQRRRTDNLKQELRFEAFSSRYKLVIRVVFKLTFTSVYSKLLETKFNPYQPFYSFQYKLFSYSSFQSVFYCYRLITSSRVGTRKMPWVERLVLTLAR